MMRDSLVLELRVLNGRHAGACVAAREGLTIGPGDDADVILTDMAAGAGMACLSLLEDGRWRLVARDEESDEASHEENSEASEAGASSGKASDLGQWIVWGGVALCVSDARSDWPSLPVLPDVSQDDDVAPEPEGPADFTSQWPDSVDDIEQDSTEETGQYADRMLLTDSDAPVLRPANLPVAPEPASGTKQQSLTLLVIVLVLLAVAAGVTFGWKRFGASTAEQTVKPAEPVDRREQAQRQIPDLQLTVAQVDPALRMEFEPLRNGRVLVKGWVEAVPALDRLADALAARKPAPLLRVYVASDVRTEIRARLASTFPDLDFAPGVAGIIHVKGVVLEESQITDAMNAVKSVLPPGLDAVSDMRVASSLPAEVQSALVRAGFDDARATWDGQRVEVNLTLEQQQRPRLEQSLLALAERFPGLPLHVKAEPVTSAQVVSRNKPPFAIRSVVGGGVPYLVLPNGAKLSPGGTHAGWRLQSIESDVLVFDFPRRLVVSR